jgi:Membrane domain of glycerophosphoryl diester phosphodiesterase
MGVGEVLDAGFTMARRNYKTLATIAAWGVIPSYAAFAISGALSAGPRASLMALSVILSLLGFVGLTLEEIALALGCARLITPEKGEEQITSAELYGLAVFRLWPVFLLYVVSGLLAVPLVILFPLGIYLFGRWAISFVAVLVEPVGPLEALRRSWDLTRGSWWHTSIVFLAGSLIGAILTYVPMLVFMGIGAGLSAITGFEPLNGLVTTVASSIALIVAAPFSTAIFVVLYFELRARSEGFDLTQRVARLATPA